MTHINAIAVSSVEGITIGKEVADVTETSDFKLFRLLLDNLSVQRGYQRCGVQQQRSVGQFYVSLSDGAKVFTRSLKILGTIKTSYNLWCLPKKNSLLTGR